MNPLVLIHGFMGGSDQWALQKPLADQRQLIALDIPGYGRNAQSVPFDSITDIALWALEHLAEIGVDRFDLLGHSMGGMIVQEMVRIDPHRVAKLVLYGTGPVGNLPGRFEPIETSMQRAQFDGAIATARRISATWFLKKEASPSYESCAQIAEQASEAAILAGLQAMKDWSGVDNLARIFAPTLILWGDGDRTYNWAQIEQLWKGIPNSNLAVLPDCAHAVHMERPVLFNQLVAEFLTHQTAPTAARSSTSPRSRRRKHTRFAQ